MTDRRLIYSPVSLSPAKITNEHLVSKATRCLESADALAGTDVNPEWKLSMIDYECILRDADTGKLILGYFPNTLDDKILTGAINSLSGVAKLTPFRGVASGKADPENILRNIHGKSNIRIETTPSRSWAKVTRIASGKSMEISNYAYSGNIGFYKKINSRTIREPKTPSPSVVEFLGEITHLLETKCPEVFSIFQTAVPEGVRYAGSPFTTITVNRDFKTAIHKDKGNYSGYSVLTASPLSSVYSGGELVFPEYGVAVPMKRGDVLIADVGGLYHGNTEFTGSRISFVVYARNNLVI